MLLRLIFIDKLLSLWPAVPRRGPHGQSADLRIVKVPLKKFNRFKQASVAFI